MVNSWSTLVSLIIFVAGAGLAQPDPDCPRHRGLPDGLTRAENKVRERALYRLDLRNAIQGYIPNEVYRFRVHTTLRKSKFNDATVVVESRGGDCGYGQLIVDSEKLYSPRGCPDTVTTQQKVPMGRAHFKWRAPSCGCVHIRVRVHANSRYFIEDEYTQNGPLARTICPTKYALDNIEVKVPTTTTPPVPRDIPVQELPRNDRLKMLCEVSQTYKAEDLLKQKQFMSKRVVEATNEFERDRLAIALEQRANQIRTCCTYKAREMVECFGDIRRRRIDSFCGSGEPDIPFTKTTYDWIKGKQSECCWQIGEDRYTCFNYTLIEEKMLKDGRIAGSEHRKADLDDFDPANDVGDYTVEKDSTGSVDKDPPRPSSKVTAEHTETSDDSVEDDDDGDSDQDTGDLVNGKRDKNEKDSDDDDVDDSGDESNTKEHRSPSKSTNLQAREDLARNRKLSSEECCYNGITAGVRVAAKGFDGCFKTADEFLKLFTNWDRKCDRRFVICCMRVIDGKWISRRILKVSHKFKIRNKLFVKTLLRTLGTPSSSTHMVLSRGRNNRLSSNMQNKYIITNKYNVNYKPEDSIKRRKNLWKYDNKIIKPHSNLIDINKSDVQLSARNAPALKRTNAVLRKMENEINKTSYHVARLMDKSRLKKQTF